MPIQYKFFHIPTVDSVEFEMELNKFLKSVKTVQVEKECVKLDTHAYWSILVEYLDTPKGTGKSEAQAASSGKSKIDYKEMLSPEDFALYAILREWRKETAAQEAVPVYTIFTNEQLAKIAEQKIDTTTALQKIPGIGDARISKYGRNVIAIVSQNHRKKDNADQK